MGNTLLRAGDLVRVVRGSDAIDNRPKRILRIMPGEGRAVVENANTKIKHVRPNPQKGHRGGRMEKSAPINLSNLVLVDPKTNENVRAAMREVDGKRVRVNKKTGEPI